MCKHKCKKSLFFGKEQASRRDARGTRDHSCLWNGLVAHRSYFFISQTSGILTRIVHKQLEATQNVSIFELFDFSKNETA